MRNGFTDHLAFRLTENFRRIKGGVSPNLEEESVEAFQRYKFREVTEVRMRWIGDWLHAEINIAVDSKLSLIEAHNIALETRHELLHNLSFLSDCIIHVDPTTRSGEEHHMVEALTMKISTPTHMDESLKYLTV